MKNFAFTFFLTLLTPVLCFAQTYDLQLDSVHVYETDFPGSPVDLIHKAIISYSAKGKNTTFTIEHRERSARRKVTKQFDKYRNLISTERAYWNGSGWEIRYKDQYFYSSDQLLDSANYQELWGSGEFFDKKTERYIYDSQKRQVEALIRSQSSPLGDFSIYKTKTVYDTQGYNQIDTILRSVSTIVERYEFFKIEKNRHNTFGRPILKIESYTQQPGLAPEDTTIWKYNNAGLLTDYIYLRPVRTSLPEINYSIKIHYRYNNQHKLVDKEWYRMEKHNQEWEWKKRQINTYYYDSLANTYIDTTKTDVFFSDSTLIFNNLVKRSFNAQYQPNETLSPSKISLPINLQFEDIELPSPDGILKSYVKYSHSPPLQDSFSIFRQDSLIFFYGPSEIPLFQAYENTSLHVYPNPTSSVLNLFLEGKPIHGDVSILDLQGKKVQQLSWTQGQPISVVSLNPGLYFVRLQAEGSVISAKFIKQ